MKKVLITFITISLINLSVVSSFSLEAAQIEDMWESMQEQKANSLDFRVIILDQKGKEVKDGVVDEIVGFKIQAVSASTQTYTLLYGVDNQAIRIYKEITLPFILKQNFKGRVERDYIITFGLKDLRGNIDKLTLTITIRHEN